MATCRLRVMSVRRALTLATARAVLRRPAMSWARVPGFLLRRTLTKMYAALRHNARMRCSLARSFRAIPRFGLTRRSVRAASKRFDRRLKPCEERLLCTHWGESPPTRCKRVLPLRPTVSRSSVLRYRVLSPVVRYVLSMTRSRCADTIVAMSSYDESLQITCELVRRHLDDAREIRPSDHIQNDLGLDSLGVMEFVSDVESHFGISIPSEMVERISTVEDVARAVSKLQHRPVAVGP